MSIDSKCTWYIDDITGGKTVRNINFNCPLRRVLGHEIIRNFEIRENERVTIKINGRVRFLL